MRTRYIVNEIIKKLMAEVENHFNLLEGENRRHKSQLISKFREILKEELKRKVNV